MSRSPKPAPPPSKSTLDDILDDLIERSHAGAALMLAARIESRLEKLLQSRMPHLSNTLKDKLFEGVGPLRTFSAKIDIAYSMGLISAGVRRDLHAMREIRNEFAHSDGILSFNHEAIDKLTPKLSAPNGLTEPSELRFFAVYKICRQEIIENTTTNDR